MTSIPGMADDHFLQHLSPLSLSLARNHLSSANNNVIIFHRTMCTAFCCMVFFFLPTTLANGRVPIIHARSSSFLGFIWCNFILNPKQALEFMNYSG